MLHFILRRLLQLIPVLFIIVTLTFFLVRFVPGGPFTSEKALSAEALQNLNAYYGLDQPLWRQYQIYVGHLLQGDLGTSKKYTNRTVSEIIAAKLPVSLELGSLALVIALLIGLPLGIVAAARRNTWIDTLSSLTGLIGICVPTFILGPILALIFGIGLKWLNVSGWEFADDRILPVLSLGLVYAAYLMRLLRGGLLEMLSQDFIRTARAKGASETRIILHHALRGGLAPVVSFLGPAVAGILTGTFVVETVFQIPGLGREFVNSVTGRDYELIIGLTLLFGTMTVLCNLVADIVHVWLNPKLRFE